MTDTQEDAAGWTTPPEWLPWEDLNTEQRVKRMLDDFTPAQWLEHRCLVVCALYRLEPDRWYLLKSLAKERGVDVFGLERAVDAVLAKIERARARAAQQETSEDPVTPPTPRPAWSS